MRLVVKVGSAVLTQDDEVAYDRMQELISFLSELKNENEVILVSSGAVSAGYTEVKLERNIIANKQALASIGQPILMREYSKRFEKYDISVAQVLVTAVNLNTDDDIQRVSNTINTLIENGVLPIVNENDATSTDELEVGDNDQLSAFIAKDLNADMLIILSDIDAYYDHDPRKNANAKVLKIVNEISEEELSRDVSPNNVFATGGIVTKLKAALYLLKSNIDTYLATGFDLRDVKDFTLNATHNGGTLFTRK